MEDVEEKMVKKQKEARRERDKWRIAVLLRSLDSPGWDVFRGRPRRMPQVHQHQFRVVLGGRGSEGKGRWLVCGFANVNNVPGTEVGFHAEVPQTDQG